MPYREREVGDCIFNFTCVPGTLPHKLKVVIAGNHDMTLDLEIVRDRRQYLSRQFTETVGTCVTEERTSSTSKKQ